MNIDLMKLTDIQDLGSSPAIVVLDDQAPIKPEFKS